MNAKKLIEILKSLTEKDVVEFGEDCEGRASFAINICSMPSLLRVGNLEEIEFPEWSKEKLENC